MSVSSKNGGSKKCCTPCGCYKTNSSSTKKVSNKNSTSCSCTQTYKVGWYFEEKTPHTNCGGPGPQTLEYWARAAMDPKGEPECKDSNGNKTDCCDCQECEDAKRDALDKARPENTTATANAQWSGPSSCSQCPQPNTCYIASVGNNGPKLPEPEIPINWSCKCS